MRFFGESYSWEDTHAPHDLDRGREMVNALCAGKGGIAGVIEDSNGRLIAGVGIVANVPWYTKETNLSQIFLCVHPSARRNRDLAKFLHDFCVWHKDDMSARLGYNIMLATSIWSFHRLEAKTRWWNARAKRAGTIFVVE